MKIYLLDRNYITVKTWSKYFNDCEDVEIVKSLFQDFVEEVDVECIVSPANSYGLMDGGYDKAITDYFGWEVAEAVQEKIINECFGEQVVGTSIIVDIPNTDKKLIHTPTMRVPSKIKDPVVVYNCMRSTLICAIENSINSIVIPAFGAATGGLDIDTVAYMMKEAYKQVMNPPKKLDWNYAERVNLEDYDY